MKGKIFNMAEAPDYRDAVVFDCQKKANTKFFEDELPGGFEPLSKEDRPSNTKRFTGEVYDITGFDGRQSVAVLSQIVNDRKKFTTNKTFYFLIRKSSENYEELLRLTAGQNWPNQPGNGIVEIRPRGYVKFTQGPKKYDQLNGALKAHYDTNTTSFAQDIKKLLKDNTQNKDIPQATTEAYMILLFEIARRLVKSDYKGKTKEVFDSLPIGSAIARFINLLELGKSRFEDVFLDKERFHCFTGKPNIRRNAIEKINLAIKNTQYPTVTGVFFRVRPIPIIKEAVELIEAKETNRQLQELRDFFGSAGGPSGISSGEEQLEKLVFLDFMHMDNIQLLLFPG